MPDETNTADATMPAQTKTKKAVKKVAAKKAVKKVAAKKAVASDVTRARLSGDMKITVTDTERAGKMHGDSRRAQSLKIITSFKGAVLTVDKYVEKGGDRTDLNIMKNLGIVAVQ